MKTYSSILLCSVLLLPYLAAADDTPLHKDSSSIVHWASGVQSISYGSNVTDDWKTPHKALGPAVGDSYDIVCLGRGGQITLTFPQGISNGSGPDFAVFENGPTDTFLELAFVEVSSDGIHFVRFYNFSLNSGPIRAFGSVNGDNVGGLASKYRQGYGTQFDLDILAYCYNNPNDPYLSLSSSYKNHIANNFPHLDLNNIQYVRLVDIVGDGSARDSSGRTIYDPYATTGSAGFDLDAVAVLHPAGSAPPPPPNTFDNWAFKHGLSGEVAADADGDGSPDLEEYFFGTAPTNQQQKASISRRISRNTFTMIYPRDPDALGRVQLQSASGLIHADWTNRIPAVVTTNTTDQGLEVELSVPIHESGGFYRLRFQPSQEP